MDKTEKLMARIAKIAQDVWGHAADTANNYYESVSAYSDLGNEANLIGAPRLFYASEMETIGDYFESVLDTSAERLEEAHDSLQKLDATLAELIELRGKLAEEIGVPIGGERWVRYDTYKV
jgi:hypothetical protein